MKKCYTMSEIRVRRTWSKRDDTRPCGYRVVFAEEVKPGDEVMRVESHMKELLAPVVADNSTYAALHKCRAPKVWRITEEGTGYAVNGDYYSTRAAAVRSITPEFLQKIADRVKCPDVLRAAETLAAFILSQNSTIDKAAASQYNKAKECFL